VPVEGLAPHGGSWPSPEDITMPLVLWGSHLARGRGESRSAGTAGAHGKEGAGVKVL